MKEKSLKRNNYIFFTLIILAIIVILICQSAGIEQNNQYLEDYKIYRSYQQLINQEKYQEAEKYLNHILPRYQDNYLVQWDRGKILLGEKKYKEAENALRLAREIRPVLVLRPEYLYNTAETYFFLKDINKAKQYLNECLKYEDSTYTTKARELMQQIEALGEVK
ncbi:hypothetical protein JCM14036_06580 [Desulfotomaculum defluvii]